ncbi:MAG: hypothetical protein WC645_01715 [Candidatus Margulisiibacteriota bacterium]
MARITEPRYKMGVGDVSRRWGQGLGRMSGKVVRSKISRFVTTVGSGAAAGYGISQSFDLLNRFDRYLDIDYLNNHPTFQKVKNIALCVLGAMIAGAVVLRALTPGILRLIKKMETIEIKPTVTDIWKLRRAFKKLGANIGHLDKFRNKLILAATQNPNTVLQAASVDLNVSLRNGDFSEALEILREDLSPALIERHNQTMAARGEHNKDVYALDIKLYAKASLSAYFRVAAEVLDSGNYTEIKSILDRGLILFDGKDVLQVLNLKPKTRERIYRAVVAANGMERWQAEKAAEEAAKAAAAVQSAVVQAVPATAPSAQPVAIPSVPPPPPPPATPSAAPPGGLPQIK